MAIRSPRKRAAARTVGKGATSRPPRPPRSKTATRKRPAEDEVPSVPSAPPQVSAGNRERRFNLLLQTACLKAGTAAALASITRKVPLLGRLAPVLIGSLGDAMSLSRIHAQLVQDVIALYQLDLTEPEERGLTLLATGATRGAQRLSRQLGEQLVVQLGGRYLQPVAARVLPLASIVTDVAGAITSTYAVGKRAQVLCNLPGSGARNLGELLRGLTGIDQRRLLSWSGEALSLALKPFRSVLSLRGLLK